MEFSDNMSGQDMEKAYNEFSMKLRKIRLLKQQSLMLAVTQYFWILEVSQRLRLQRLSSVTVDRKRVMLSLCI